MATRLFSLVSLLFLTIFLSLCETSTFALHRYLNNGEENDVFNAIDIKTDEKERKHLNTDQNEIFSKEEESKEVKCHRSAVWHCGHTLIKVFKFLDYLPKEQFHQTKCALRNEKIGEHTLVNENVYYGYQFVNLNDGQIG